MGVIVSRVNRTRQPLGPVGFNPAFPRPKFCVVGSVPVFDLVSKRQGSKGSTDLLTATSQGRVYRTVRSSTCGLNFGTWQPLPTDTWTVIVLANPPADSNRQLLYSQRAASGAGMNLGGNLAGGFGLSNGAFGVACQDNGSGLVFGVTSNAVTYVDGKFHIYGATRPDAASAPQLYYDGIAVSQTSNGLAPASTVSTSQETVIGRPGNYSSDSTYSSNSDFALVLAFDVVLTPAQMWALGQNLQAPWQIFAPIQRRTYFTEPAANTPLFRSRTIFGSRAGSRQAT